MTKALQLLHRMMHGNRVRNRYALIFILHVGLLQFINLIHCQISINKLENRIFSGGKSLAFKRYCQLLSMFG